jgi:hypothetical protein
LASWARRDYKLCFGSHQCAEALQWLSSLVRAN